MKLDKEALKTKFLQGSWGILLISNLLGYLIGDVILLLAGFNPLEASMSGWTPRRWGVFGARGSFPPGRDSGSSRLFSRTTRA